MELLNGEKRCRNRHICAGQPEQTEGHLGGPQAALGVAETFVAVGLIVEGGFIFCIVTFPTNCFPWNLFS